MRRDRQPRDGHALTLHVLGISGSLRAASHNRALLRAATTLVPEGMVIDVADIGAIPLYDGDVEARGLPQSVVELRERVRAADALLIVTPEYNHSIPGVLKNTLDWLSRPPDPHPLAGKPGAIMGTSTGMFGSVRSQEHLRNVAATLSILLVTKPEVMVPRADDKFDAAGELTDKRTREAVRELLVALQAWTVRLGPRI